MGEVTARKVASKQAMHEGLLGKSAAVTASVSPLTWLGTLRTAP